MCLDIELWSVLLKGNRAAHVARGFHSYFGEGGSVILSSKKSSGSLMSQK